MEPLGHLGKQRLEGFRSFQLVGLMLCLPLMFWAQAPRPQLREVPDIHIGNRLWHYAKQRTSQRRKRSPSQKGAVKATPGLQTKAEAEVSNQ